MKVLVYIGYQHEDITPFHFEVCRSIGGTEIVAKQLAENLAKLGHDVTFGGRVTNTTLNGVKWADLASVEVDRFDVAIGASYLHFIDTIKADRYYFWFHNTDFYPWLRGEAVIGPDRLNDERITGIIALTEWHKQQLIRDYNLTKPIHVIGNSIDRNTFNSWPTKKTPASFVYSSARERGLDRLLKMWPEIKQNIPDATLNVFTPGYDRDQLPDLELDGVHFRGSVGPKELHQWQQKSEYWLHPTTYEETYCVTALEAQYAGCIPVTTNLAALSEVVGDRGLLCENNETNEAFINIIKVIHRSPKFKAKLRSKAYEWAKQQAWNLRIREWQQIIEQK